MRHDTTRYFGLPQAVRGPVFLSSYNVIYNLAALDAYRPSFLSSSAVVRCIPVTNLDYNPGSPSGFI